MFPDVVVDGWVDGNAGHGRRVLKGYLGVLNAGTAYGEGGGMLSRLTAQHALTLYADNGPVQATSTASVILSPAVSPS